jgi:hypothetical protein
MRHPGKKGGVHTTRVGDDQARMAGENLAQAFSFLIECGRRVHDIYYLPKKFCARLDSRGGCPYVMRG